MRNPSAVVKDIEGGGYELAQFIPVVRQAQPWRVREEKHDGKQGQKKQVSIRTDAAAGGGRRDHWTVPAAGGCGSSLISPKAVSYWLTFCWRTLSNALACCGLR